MLEGSFYTITKHTQEGQELRYLVRLNPDHPIYAGHFPGMPVTPGVLQLAIIKGCFEAFSGKVLYLKRAREIKFLGLIKPGETAELVINISYDLLPGGSYKISATISDSNRKLLSKMRGEFSDEQ